MAIPKGYFYVSPGVYKDAKGKVYKPKDGNPANLPPINGKPKGNTPAPVQSGTNGAEVVPNASDPVQTAIGNEADVEKVESAEDIKYNNPNVNTAFGSSTTTVDENGNVTVDQKLSDDQQKILDQGSKLTQMGQELAQQNMQGYQPFQMGQDTVADRARIEDEVFGRLTRTTDRDFDRERQALEQKLYNKGVPIDPTNPQYKAEMDALNERYDQVRANARAQATELGGQEYQRAAGIGLASHQQGMSDTNSLQNMGVGLQVPNFPQFQGTQYDLNNPTDIDILFKQLKNQTKQTNVDAEYKKKMAAQAGGGGGGETDSPFETA